MKWALVLALVLCCGWTKGETENDRIESLDKLTEQLEQEFLFRKRNLLADPECTKTCNANEECYTVEGGEEKCRCLKKFAKKGDECVECTKDCQANEECYFDDKSEEQCRCVEKFAKKDGACVACNAVCGENAECYFDEENGEKCRCVEKFEKDGETCKSCDCGKNGTCSFGVSSQPVCACDALNEVQNGKCAYCYCGEKGKCSFNGEDRVCSCEAGYAEDKDITGECKACDCGETTSTGCEFTGGKKICKCKDENSQKGNKCEACTKDCSKGNEECYFDDGGEAQCRCIKKFSRKGEECVACNTDCKENEECYFDEKDAEKCRCVEKFEKDVDTCKPCDCGKNGTCSFDGNIQPVCTCDKQNEVKNGKCAYCSCGGKGKCSFNGEDRVCSCDDGYAEDKDTTGECKETCDPDKKNCFNDAKCEAKNGNNFCTCVPGLTGDLCQNITACEKGGTYEKCSAGGGTCKFSNDDGKAVCDCEDGKHFDTKMGLCRGTCDLNTKKCGSEAKCEDQEGHTFCTCPEGLTGDLCEVITDCQKGKKYEKCSAGGGTCKFSSNDGKAVCDCADGKYFDTKKGLCRSTCDSNTKKCEHGAKCEDQGGQTFCTCPEGLTGDLCDEITDCQKGKKYEKCSADGGTCTFSNDDGKAVCECGGGRYFDTKMGKCRSTCDSTTKKCVNEAKCEDQDGHSFCTCAPGLAGDLCQVITDCKTGGKYENCTALYNHECTFSNKDGKAVCKCADDKKFDTRRGQCSKTCEDDEKCEKEFRCGEPIEGYKFCVCKEFMTGYDCNLIKDCLPPGKYANCEKAGGMCWHNEARSKCDCKDGKGYDTKSEACRATCDPNKSECAYGAKCEVQDGKNFCTCAAGLTGDLCKIINECQPNGKYGKCESSGGNCTFSGGNAVCKCGTGKLLDPTDGQCKDTCGSVICRNGAQCKDGKCECPTGLSGADCGTVDGCTEDFKKICQAIPSKCIYDSKKATKATCECAKENQKFDGETCKECSCGENQECFFDEKKEKQCPCIDKFSDNDGNCEKCDCGTNGNCSFVNGEKECDCNDLYKDDEGICKICDCGKNGVCSFEDHKKTCDCEDGFKELDGICKECDCGKDGECSFENNKKICSCNEGYSEYNGICTKPCKTKEDCKHNNITTCKEKTEGVSFCDCKKIFTGHRCEKVVDCETGVLKDCLKSGGECSYNFTQTKAVCECNEEKKFDKGLNICRTKCKNEEACKNGAKCQDELCVCPKGTSGDDCATVDGCDPDFKEKCENIKATCVYDNTTNGATCQCENNDLEYKDNKCTAKWCDSNPCKAKVSVCVYGFRSAFCKCTESGKYYDYATNNCIAIDKCPFAPCKENEICTDDGTCVCDKNHEKDKDGCKKKNLCTPSPCSLNATCEEGKSIGTVKCECPSHTYLNAKSTCEVMIKEEDKCKDGKYCGPFGYCVKDGDTSKCACKKDLAVLDNTGVCILNGQKACLSKTVLSNDNKKCNCSGKLKDSTNGITCESMTCGDEAAQQDCKSKGAYCVDTKDSNNKLKTYDCECSAGQTLTKDKGCVDACSDKAGECAKNQQTCYIDENGFATCKCPPGFTEINTNGKITCQLNVQFSYILKELPVMKKEFLNEDQSLNKVKLNQYVIKSMKALSSTSYEFASVQNFRISDDVILCDVWLKFNKDAEQDVKRWRSQVVITNDSFVLPPSLKLSSVELNKVTYEKLEFCSPLVYQTACGRQGSKCDKNACSCMDGYDVVGPTVQVIEGNTVMRCEDIDECKENKHSCKANSECKNIMGGHYCKCNPGFHKKDKNESEDCVELCSPNPCTNGDCAVDEKENRVECSCKAGFKGSYCAASDDELKKAQHSTKVVGAVLGTILAVTFVAIIAYVVKLKKNSYSEDFSTSPRDNSEMAERPLRGMSNRGYQ